MNEYVNLYSAQLEKTSRALLNPTHSLLLLLLLLLLLRAHQAVPACGDKCFWELRVCRMLHGWQKH